MTCSASCRTSSRNFNNFKHLEYSATSSFAFLRSSGCPAPLWHLRYFANLLYSLVGLPFSRVLYPSLRQNSTNGVPSKSFKLLGFLLRFSVAFRNTIHSGQNTLPPLSLSTSRERSLSYNSDIFGWSSMRSRQKFVAPCALFGYRGSIVHP